MDGRTQPITRPHRWTRRWRGLAVLVLAFAALGFAPPPVLAEGGGSAEPSPRVSLVLDSTSVVVIAAQQKLYAFVDGYDDNAPISGAEVQIGTPRAALTLHEISPGIYLSGTYVPPSVRTPLTVSVTHSGTTVRGTAELLLPNVPEAVGAGHARPGSWLFVLALLAGAALGLWRYLHPESGWWRHTKRAA